MTRTALAAALGLAMAWLPPAAAAPMLLDRVELGSGVSRVAHEADTGSAQIVAGTAPVGTLLLSTGGARIDQGGRIRVRLARTNAPGRLFALVTLATPPADQGKRQEFGVRVDGRHMADLAAIDPGAGVSRSFWVPVPPGEDRCEITVAVPKGSEVPVTVATIQTVRLPATRESDARDRMPIALLTRKTAGYEIDAPEMEQMKTLFPQSPWIGPQAAVLYNFAARTYAENRAEIHRLATIAAAVRMPLRIAFQMHWAGIPMNVPDGAGGKFGDLAYQQVVFDKGSNNQSADMDALMGELAHPGFGQSVPNNWGNTPWLTFNHPRLNQLRRVRLIQALTAWRAERDLLYTNRLQWLLPPELSTGEETVYWAKGVDDSGYSKATGKPARTDLMADFNPYVLNEALAAGVRLDPRDGLAYNERWWLHQNLARWQQEIVWWMQAGCPAEPIRVSQSGITPAHDLVRRNIFTEPYAMPLYPMKDVTGLHPGIEVGYVTGGRPGGEFWSGAQMLPWLLKQREIGRVAIPNIEMTGAGDPQIEAALLAGYACGSRFATLYNWQTRPGTTALLKAFSGSVTTGAPIAFAANPSPQMPRPVEGQAPVRYQRTYVAPANAFAINRVDLPIAAGPADDSAVQVTLWRPGTSGRLYTAALASVSATSGGVLRIFLPAPFHQQPGSTYAVSAKWVGSSPCRLLASGDGALAVTMLADVVGERERSLFMQDCQDAADILSDLHRSFDRVPQTDVAIEQLKVADRLMAQLQPVAAYKAAVMAEQVAVPATYDIPAPGGRLAPYWVTVRVAEAQVRATIRSYTPQMARILLTSPRTQQVILRWGGREALADLTANVTAEVIIEQKPAPPALPRAPRKPGRHQRRQRLSLQGLSGRP